MTVEEVNAALATGMTWKPYSSPGVEMTLLELERLESQGLAERIEGGWQLTDAGNSEYQRLEDLFDNSNGYGDYGF